MKKFFAMILSVALLLSVIPTDVYAASARNEVASSNITYTIKDNTLHVDLLESAKHVSSKYGELHNIRATAIQVDNGLTTDQWSQTMDLETVVECALTLPKAGFYQIKFLYYIKDEKTACYMNKVEFDYDGVTGSTSTPALAKGQLTYAKALEAEQEKESEGKEKQEASTQDFVQVPELPNYNPYVLNESDLIEVKSITHLSTTVDVTKVYSILDNQAQQDHIVYNLSYIDFDDSNAFTTGDVHAGLQTVFTASTPRHGIYTLVFYVMDNKSTAHEKYFIKWATYDEASGDIEMKASGNNYKPVEIAEKEVKPDTGQPKSANLNVEYTKPVMRNPKVVRNNSTGKVSLTFYVIRTFESPAYFSDDRVEYEILCRKTNKVIKKGYVYQSRQNSYTINLGKAPSSEYRVRMRYQNYVEKRVSSPWSHWYYGVTDPDLNLKYLVKNVKKNSLKLKWGKIKDADAYTVYMGTSKKKMKKVKLTEDCSLKITKLNGKKLKTRGKTFYIKIITNDWSVFDSQGNNIYKLKVNKKGKVKLS